MCLFSLVDLFFFFLKQKTAYEMRISDWSSDVCSSDLYGAFTGRPRRCGWIDIVALKRAVAINGISGLCITKLDVLDGMDKLKMCIAYRYRGKETEYAPLDEIGRASCRERVCQYV